MKKVALLFVFLCGLFLLSACGVDANLPSGGDSTQQPENVTSVVSVYDMQMNLLGQFSYYNTTENTMDVSQFAKTGYKLEGIFDMNRDVMLFNANGKQVPTVMLDTDFTAVVKYSPITYQLLFDAGEGELYNEAEYTKMISYEEAVGLFPRVECQGMELDGWFDAAGNRYSNGTTPVAPKFNAEGYALSGEVITLYARYTVKCCDVRLIMQDGSEDIRLTLEYGQPLPDLSQYLKDDGSRAIVGFGVSPNASEPYTDAVYTDLDLYALWREYKYVSFVYSETETKVVKIFREGNQCTLPEGQWPGYEFEGWYASALLSGNKITTIAFGSLQDVYYGKWSVGSYTIQFVADGVLIGSYTYDIYNAEITPPPVPEKANYTGSWEDYTLDFQNKVVNAIYTPKDMKLALVNGAEYSYQTVSYGSMYTLPVPSKVGHNFTGWYYQDQPVTDAAGNALAPYTFDGPVTLTAGWEAKICKLYFASNGGTAIDTVEVAYGVPYILTQRPERAGYHFDGWYDESMEQMYIGSVTITADTVVYAKWIKSTAIATLADLRKIADNPAGNYHLVADIDLKGGDWAPIENFTGVLDGNGHKIHNFSLRQNGASTGFVITNGGTIKNIVFSNLDLSGTLEGGYDCAFGVVAAFNHGNIIQVTVEKASILVNVSGSAVNHHVRVGALVGESTGLVTHCTVQAELMFKVDTRLTGYGGDTRNANLFVGGAVGKDSGTIAYVQTDVFVDANEYVYSTCQLWENYLNTYLHIGGIVGGTYGTVMECSADLDCQLYTKAEGNAETRRYTNVGGIAGCCYELSSVTGCYSEGTISFQRLGRYANSFEMAVGGIVGKLESGTVNNCASGLDITVVESAGTTTGGIVGWLDVNGKASNVAYYGTIQVEASSEGWFGGLAGRVSGWLTKGYFRGEIQSGGNRYADIVGKIDASGSVSKTLGYGNTGVVFAENNGSAIYNYLIGLDYGADALYDRELLFDTLGLYEADFWGIDEVRGLYLITFMNRIVGGDGA